MSNEIIKSDDTDAFGGNFLRVSLASPIPEGRTISKAVIAIGSIHKEYTNPVFPLDINLSSEETAQLQCVNQAFMAVWDGDGKKATCEGTITVKAKPRKV